MADNDDSLAVKIEEIRQMFLQRIRDEWLMRLSDLRRKLTGEWDRAMLEDLLFLTHTLAGSGATFGYKAISDVALKVEIATRAIIRGETGAAAEALAEILQGLELLEGESRKALVDLRTPS